MNLSIIILSHRSTTPRRKISIEEKQNLNTSALPQLSTVIEVNSQFATNLTESSSSGADNVISNFFLYQCVIF